MSLLERIFYFHREIEQNNYPNARSIVDHFEVSRATAVRDIAYLRDRLLAPLLYDEKRHGYRYGEKEFNLPFTESPRIILFLAMLNRLADETGLGTLQEIKRLQERLGQMVEKDHGKLRDLIDFRWIEVEYPDNQIFATVLEALVKKRLVDLSYKGLGGAPSNRKIAPLRLLNYQGGWYLNSYCLLRKDYRLFHLARITRARLLQQDIPLQYLERSQPEDESFGIFQTAPAYTASILFTATAAELIANQHWHPNQIIEETGEGLILHLPVGDEREIVMKILQYGAMAKVLSPQSLVERLEREVRAMAENYQLTS